MMYPMPAIQKFTITQNNEITIAADAINGCTSKLMLNVLFILKAKLKCKYVSKNCKNFIY